MLSILELNINIIVIRAFIYWRMLAKNPYMTKTIVLQEKPPITDTLNNLETSLLDK